ncbi:MAG TPA: DUF4129 domain-containing protein [Candidatus Acidoferrales bacterium]|nr:DUF4129 domain-containing protein [Candidatus Acidoferrales bacterium]
MPKTPDFFLSMSAAAQPNPLPSADAIREVTREVLARPEFAPPSTWDEFLVYLLQRLQEWMKGLASWSAENPGLAKLVALALVLTSLIVLGHLFYLALGDLLPFGRRQLPGPARPSRWEILAGAARNWQEAIAIARQLAREGNLRRAVWIAHRVMLGLLDEEGAVRFAGWKTNSQYLRECSASHPWRRTFAQLTELYERLIYADRGAQPAAVESLVATVERLSRERTK